MTNGIDRDELRRLVREVLKQALPLAGSAELPAGAPSNMIERMRQALLPGGSGLVEVAGDLSHFARDVMHAAAHEDLKAAVMCGKLAFKAAQNAPLAPARRENPAKSSGTFNLSDGILNELRIEEIGRQYGRIVLGPDVVVTPLARDRARELKLELIRTKP